jgi:hypothetical protein
MGRIRRVAMAVLAGCSLGAPARADRIIVRNGPPIKGKAIIDEAHPDQYLVFGEKGKTPIIMKRERVARIDPDPSVLDGYAERRKALPKSGNAATVAQAEYDLAAWCEEHRLLDLASVHYESSIRRDPSFGPGHKKLGHVEHEGKWLTPTEVKIAQGYTLYKGRWITPEEKAERDSEATATAEQQSWIRRLGILRQAITGTVEARARDAENQLLEIREAGAVRPIVRVFGVDEDPSLRKLAARALAGIPGPEASAALVARLLAESDDDVRAATMAALVKSKETNVVPKLVQGLRSTSLAVVNRAAWALGNLNAVTAVPKLIPVLISSEIQTVWVPAPGSPGSGFGSVAPGTNFAMGGRTLSIPVLTGPSVGPGAVAFGATSIPVSNYGGGFNVNMNAATQGPTPQFVEVSHRNVEVLTALMKLTGQDFGYDVATWKRWLSTNYRPDPQPAKRVPQP